MYSFAETKLSGAGIASRELEVGRTGEVVEELT